MKRSVLEPNSKIHQQLLKLPDIVDEFQQKKYSATEHYIAWLTECEHLLKELGYSETATLSGLRAGLVATQQTTTNRSKKRKTLTTQALESIDRAQETLLGRQKILEEKIEHARNLLRQILPPILESGAFNPQGNTINAEIEQLMSMMKNNNQLAPILNQLTASVGRFDLMRLIAEEVTQRG